MRNNSIQNQENNDLILNSNSRIAPLKNKSRRPFLIESTKKLSEKQQNDHTKENIPFVSKGEQYSFYNPKDNHKYVSEILSMLGIKNRKDLNDLFYTTFPLLPMNPSFIQFPTNMNKTFFNCSQLINKYHNDSTSIYQESCHLSIIMLILKKKIEQIQGETAYLSQKIEQVNNLINNSKSLQNAVPQNDQVIIIDKKKRYRRISLDIDRSFVCSQINCNKAYGYCNLGLKVLSNIT